MEGDEVGENEHANFFIYLLKDSIKWPMLPYASNKNNGFYLKILIILYF